jgi:hypothetical protein
MKILKVLDHNEGFLDVPDLPLGPFKADRLKAQLFGTRAFLLHQIGFGQQGLHWAKLCMEILSSKKPQTDQAITEPMSLCLALQVKQSRSTIDKANRFSSLLLWQRCVIHMKPA